MYLKKVRVCRFELYYDVDKRVLGRKPTRLNIAFDSPDNSLYFGIKESLPKEFSISVVEKITGISINDFVDFSFKMRWNNEPVTLETNINRQGQLQLKIIYRGYKSGVSIIANEFLKQSKGKKYGIFIDFANSEVYC